MKSLFLIASILFTASFAKAAVQLQHSTAAMVVPGNGSTCADKRSGQAPTPASLQSDFFLLNTFRIYFQGADDLIPAAIKFTINHPYLEGGRATCTIAGRDLEETFGAGRHSSGTIDMNNPALGSQCGIGCGGIRRLPEYENTPFSTDATVEFMGYSEIVSGQSVTIERALSKVRLNFF